MISISNEWELCPTFVPHFGSHGSHMCLWPKSGAHLFPLNTSYSGTPGEVLEKKSQIDKAQRTSKDNKRKGTGRKQEKKDNINGGWRKEKKKIYK